MATDPRCDIGVGVHPGHFWIDRTKNLRVCQRHRLQFEERADEFGPFAWERQLRSDLPATPDPEAQ